MPESFLECPKNASTVDARQPVSSARGAREVTMTAVLRRARRDRTKKAKYPERRKTYDFWPDFAFLAAQSALSFMPIPEIRLLIPKIRL
jgi:hypothetical protein